MMPQRRNSGGSRRTGGVEIASCTLAMAVMHFASGTALGEMSIGRTIFVNVATRATHADGRSEETAFPTIQQACDSVNPGDTIVVAPGVYFEHVRLRRAGIPGNPITIRADRVQRGRVVVTGANRAIREGAASWELVDAAIGLYAVSHETLRQRPSRVLYSGTDLQPYPTLGELRRFTFAKPEGYPGPAHGFAWDEHDQRLFVRLHGSGKYGTVDPGRHVMAVAPRNGGGTAGLSITQSEHYNIGIFSAGTHPADSHVVIDGFTLETPGVAGVFIESAGAVTVRNCWCVGCRTGVSGRRFFNNAPDYMETTNAVTVEYCDFTQFPAFDDMVEVIQRGAPSLGTATEDGWWKAIFWWHRKGTPDGLLLGYTDTYETGLATAVGRAWVFRRNLIHDAFEGFSTWSLSTSRDTLIEGNRFERLVDNAVESENHANNLTVRDNTIIDVFEPFSWQPLSGTPWPGPVSIHRNSVLTTPPFHGLWRDAGNRSGTGWFPAIFKIGAPERNWDTRENPWMEAVPRSPLTIPMPGFRAWGNTIVAPGHRLVGRTGTATHYENFVFHDNLIVVDDFNGADEFFRNTGIVYERNAVFLSAPRDRIGASLAAGPRGRVLATFAEAGMRAFSTSGVASADAKCTQSSARQAIDGEQSSRDSGSFPVHLGTPAQVVGPQLTQ